MNALHCTLGSHSYPVIQVAPATDGEHELLFLEILMSYLSRQRRISRCTGAFTALMVLGLTAATASAQSIDFRTMAGASPAGDEDGTGTAARFNAPTSVAVDAAGNVY